MSMPWLARIVLALASGNSNDPATQPPAAAGSIPQEVAVFLERRELCDHWRGEEAYDEERRAEIIDNACTWCAGTDSQLAALKLRYAQRADVRKRLDALDAKVEPAGAMADACRKPAE